MSPSDAQDPAQKLASAVDKQAQTANEKEEKLWSGGYSPRAMLGSWLLCLIATGAIIAGVLFLPKLGVDQVEPKIAWSIGGGAIVAIWGIAACIYLYRRISVRYELTTQRFILRHGILLRTTDRIELIDISDVSFTQGIVERMMNVGTIRIISSDRTDPDLSLSGIEDVGRVSGLIDDARRKERRKRALHIETT